LTLFKNNYTFAPRFIMLTPIVNLPTPGIPPPGIFILNHPFNFQPSMRFVLHLLGSGTE